MKLLKTACGLAFASLLTACVVPPPVVRPVYAPAPVAVYEPPPGVVYLAPTYALPAPGFAWRFNARYGWGWHHPQRGWHRGWR